MPNNILTGVPEEDDNPEEDTLVILGYLAHELATHTTQEELIKNCARTTHIDPHFIRELLSDCRTEFMNRWIANKP